MLQPIGHSWPEFHKLVHEQLAKPETKKVLEIGPGFKPYLLPAEVSKYNIDYVLLDVDEKALKSHQKNFRILLHNLEEESFDEKFDLVFSHMVLEHIQRPNEFHRHILSLMHYHTVVIHFFATKYGLPSLANILLPSSIADFLVYKIQKRNPEKDARYPAYYRKCTGPTTKINTYYDHLGYEIINYRGYLGHSYFSYYPILKSIEELWNRIIRCVNSPFLCSNAILCIRKRN